MAPSFASSMFSFIRKFINYDTQFSCTRVVSYRSIYTSTILSLCIIIHIPMTFSRNIYVFLSFFHGSIRFPTQLRNLILRLYDEFPDGISYEYGIFSRLLRFISIPSKYREIWIDLEFYRLSFLLFAIDEFRKIRDYIMLKKK